MLCYTISTKYKEREFMYDYNESHLSGTDLDYIYNDDGPIYMNRKSAPSYKFLRNKKSETKVKEPDTLTYILAGAFVVLLWPIAIPLIILFLILYFL